MTDFKACISPQIQVHTRISPPFIFKTIKQYKPCPIKELLRLYAFEPGSSTSLAVESTILSMAESLKKTTGIEKAATIQRISTPAFAAHLQTLLSQWQWMFTKKIDLKPSEASLALTVFQPDLQSNASPKESDVLLSNTAYMPYWHHKTIWLQARITFTLPTTHKQKEQPQKTHPPKTIPHFHRIYSLLKWRESTKPYKSCQKNMGMYGLYGMKTICNSQQIAQVTHFTANQRAKELSQDRCPLKTPQIKFTWGFWAPNSNRYARYSLNFTSISPAGWKQLIQSFSN